MQTRPRPGVIGVNLGELDLLPYLEPPWRAQLAHAVWHVGLIGALRRINPTMRPQLIT